MFVKVSRHQVASGYSYSGHYGGKRRSKDSETDSSESEAEAADCFVRPQHYQGGNRRICHDESSEDEDSETEEDESDDGRHVKGNDRHPRSQYRQYPKNKYESDESSDEEDDEEDEEEEDCSKVQREKCYGCSRKSSARNWKYHERVLLEAPAPAPKHGARVEVSELLKKLTLSPSGRHVQLKESRSFSDNEGRGRRSPRKSTGGTVIIKDLHLNMMNNNIEDFTWTKKVRYKSH